MNLPRYKLLILGAVLIAIGIGLRVFGIPLSDLVFGIGLLIILSAAFLYTYKAKENRTGEER